jgi:tetratricopeptide (TPR) repeat protein
MNTPQFGLRSTVRMFGTVVEQGVIWKQKRDWTDIGAAVPTDDGGPIGSFRCVAGEFEIRDSRGLVTSLGEHQPPWEWANGKGIAVSIDRIEMVRARRTSGEAWGDVALLVLMLTLMVGVGQLNTLFAMIVGERVVSTSALAPSPELIARLLRQEFGGEDRGQVAVVQRPDMPRKAPSYFMPAGSTGPMEHIGGGKKAGPVSRRTSSSDSENSHQSKAISTDQHFPTGERIANIEDLLPQLPLAAKAVQRPESKTRKSMSTAMERFVGWGFRDWLNVAEIPASEKSNMERRLQVAQGILRIDPDDPFSVLTVASYAYLSENYTLCREMYGRYLKLFPADAAGWNNLALTYKRTREYHHEEDLYRLALVLEPDNFFTKNNLAVNLAHQGRFDEANSLMNDVRMHPDQRPYADLHMAKIAASQGKDRRAYRFLKQALAQVQHLNTSHHIEFRQDIRVDPSFDRIRSHPKFRRLLFEAYGDDTPIETASVRHGKVEMPGG